MTSVLKGIQEKTDGKAEVLYSKGCELVDANWPESELIDFPLTEEEQKEIDKAVSQAKEADVAVVVLGGGQRTCGENKSRSSLDLPGRQLDLLKAVVATANLSYWCLSTEDLCLLTGLTSLFPPFSKRGIRERKVEKR